VYICTIISCPAYSLCEYCLSSLSLINLSKMYFLLALSAGIAAVNAMPNFGDSLSQGGHATCLTGNIAVPASAMNTHLNYPLPANQYVSREHFSSCSGVSQEEFHLRRRPLSNHFLLRHLLSRHVSGAQLQIPPEEVIANSHSRIDPSSPKQSSNSSKSPPPYPPKS
jgi:hypothetical protein